MLIEKARPWDETWSLRWTPWVLYDCWDSCQVSTKSNSFPWCHISVYFSACIPINSTSNASVITRAGLDWMGTVGQRRAAEGTKRPSPNCIMGYVSNVDNNQWIPFLKKWASVLECLGGWGRTMENLRLGGGYQGRERGLEGGTEGREKRREKNSVRKGEGNDITWLLPGTQ